MIIAVVNTKGGTAKTTSTIFLAVAFTRRGYPTTVIDLDAQGSATEWADRAEASGGALPFPVEVTNLRRLPRLADRHRTANNVVVIDTPPGDPDAIDAAIKAADFVLVPSQASPIEIARVWETLPALQNKPHGILITAARLGTRSLEQATKELESHDVSMFTTRIPIREGIRDTFGEIPEKSYGYDDVVAEIQEVLA